MTVIRDDHDTGWPWYEMTIRDDSDTGWLWYEIIMIRDDVTGWFWYEMTIPDDDTRWRYVRTCLMLAFLSTTLYSASLLVCYFVALLCSLLLVFFSTMLSASLLLYYALFTLLLHASLFFLTAVCFSFPTTHCSHHREDGCYRLELLAH